MLVTAYEYGNPIHIASLAEMAAWLTLQDFTYVPGTKAVWCLT